MVKRSRDEASDEPMDEGSTHLSDQHYKFQIDCGASSPESAGSIWLQSDRSGQNWECLVQDADAFTEDAKGIPRPMVLKAVASILESTSGSKKARKPASTVATFLPAATSGGDGNDDSREFVLLVPLQIEVGGILWQPKYKFTMQPVASEPGGPLRAKMRAVERENVMLKKELAVMKKEVATMEKRLKARTEEDSERPMATRTRKISSDD